MIFYSTGEAAKKIGISLITLKRYIAAKKIPLPPPRVGGIQVRLWSEADIAAVKEVLPKIANGRKTRWQRHRETEEKRAQPRSAALPKKRRTKKKK